MTKETLLLIAVAACSSSSGAPGTEEANPCATPGASYLESFVEMAGGTCGPLSNAIVNISSSGTITTETPLTCGSTMQTGCTAQDTDCSFATNGTTCSVTTDVTYASDGSGAMGLETLTCTMGTAGCTSTYQVTATRQ